MLGHIKQETEIFHTSLLEKLRCYLSNNANKGISTHSTSYIQICNLPLGSTIWISTVSRELMLKLIRIGMIELSDLVFSKRSLSAEDTSGYTSYFNSHSRSIYWCKNSKIYDKFQKPFSFADDLTVFAKEHIIVERLERFAKVSNMKLNPEESKMLMCSANWEMLI